MREFIRHPTDIPIEYEIIGGSAPEHGVTVNVGQGGLCFPTRECVEPGTRIRLQIPLLDPVFATFGTVVWSHETETSPQVGVEFDDPQSAFNVRMIEQICHIEQYRRDVLATEGRAMTSERAAREWIALYAEDFPR